MLRHFVLLFAMLAELLLIAGPAFADDGGTLRLRRGWTSFEVRDEYGEPDRIQGDNSSVASWYYGSATVFFSGGKVTAWSEAKHLAELAARRRTVRREDERWSVSPENVTDEVADEVLDELVSEMK